MSSQIGRHLPDDISVYCFNENVRIFIAVSLTFVRKDLIDTMSARVQIMDRWPTENIPLPKPMVSYTYDAMQRH